MKLVNVIRTIKVYPILVDTITIMYMFNGIQVMLGNLQNDNVIDTILYIMVTRT